MSVPCYQYDKGSVDNFGYPCMVYEAQIVYRFMQSKYMNGEILQKGYMNETYNFILH